MGYALKDRIWSVTVGALVGGVKKGLKVNGHRVSFRVEKTLKVVPNVCECSIYNLSKMQRAQIEELQPKAGDARGIPLLIEAGYKAGGLSQVWLGDLRAAYSEREGPNSATWVTKIESGGHGIAKKSPIAVAYGPGTSPDIALRALVRALGLDEGNVAAAAIKLRQAGGAAIFPQRLVLSGSALRQLDLFCQSAGLEFSIQDQAVLILDRSGIIGNQAIKLSTKDRGTGLIESPSVDPLGVMTCKMLMQPLRCGAKIVLDSNTVQGNYRVRKAVWDGDSHGQPWYITVEGTRY
jgi:hypothetical protein